MQIHLLSNKKKEWERRLNANCIDLVDKFCLFIETGGSPEPFPTRIVKVSFDSARGIPSVLPFRAKRSIRVRDTIHRVVTAQRAKTRGRCDRTLWRPTRRDVSEDFTKSIFKQRKAGVVIIDKYEIIDFSYLFKVIYSTKVIYSRNFSSQNFL